MNKDNYIRLLEKENQEYFEKVMKTMKDCCCHEIPELNGEINELLDDLNDLRADWAESNVVAGTAMWGMAKDIARLTEERDRFRGNIRELKKEKYDMGMELEKLKKQNKNLKMYSENFIEDLETARARIKEMEENK